MQYLWPLALILGYYLAPAFGIFLWLRQIWQLRSGALRALAAAVLILTLSISLNAQSIPSYNAYWLLMLGIAVFCFAFLPNTAQARPYLLTTQALFLITSLALHLHYAYFHAALQFDNSFTYYALPCLAACLALAWPFFQHQKRIYAKIAILVLSLIIGLTLGQAFYLSA